MARAPLKYYWDKSVHRWAHTHNSIVGLIGYGVAVVGISITAAQQVPDDLELPVFEQSVQKNENSDAAYQMLDRQITETHAAGLDIQQQALRIAEQDIAGADVEDRKDALENSQDAHQDRIGRLYGYLLQNEDITELQFAQLQNRIVEYSISHEGREISLAGLNPDTLRECQKDVGINDGHPAAKNAELVQNCMVRSSDVKAYRADQVEGTALGAFFLSALGLAVLGFGLGTVANNYTYSPRPRREDYLPKHYHN